MFGALEFSLEMVSKGIQPIIGIQVNIAESNENEIDIGEVVLIAKNEIGYKNLLALTSQLNNNIDYKKEKAIKISIYASDGENSERQLILNKKQIAAIDKQKMHLSKFLGAIDDPKVIEGLLIQTLKELNNGE